MVGVQQSQADTAVWEITKGDATVYVGGTIHVLSPRDYPLPSAFESAYKKAATLYFEVDIGELSSPEFSALFGRSSAYPLGVTLQSKLSAETWTLFDTYMKGLGLSGDAVNHLRPGAVMSTLLSLELLKMGASAQGVDQHFYQKALADGKNTGSLETVAQQIELITTLGQENEDEFIQYLVGDMSKFSGLFGQLKDAWLHGDNSRLLSLGGIDVLEVEDPATYQSLLAGRNHSWLPEIESMFQTPDVELVLVGALHLAGEDGLLTLLRQKGYEVNQLNTH